ncbi:MAG: NAD(+)/NADH kinase [Peptococcaceae bacterium]|nr:NAD(+)/NADH kinase [Peptococcaceae bacterium]
MHQAVGIYYNVNRGDIVEIAQHIVELLAQHHVEAYVNDNLLSVCAGVPYLPDKEFLNTITMMVVIGGDGTFLRAANIVRQAEIPMIGINRGNLGFLTELEVEEFEERLPELLAGQYAIEERMNICAELYRDGTCIQQSIGLNDIAINRHPVENTLELDVYLLNQLIDSYQADGVIVATPTGSTGYSLSAGGPLIFPGTDCLIFNPICAHVLGTNSIIVPADGVLDIHLTRSEKNGYLLTDGRLASNIVQGDTVRVYRAETATKIIQLEEHQFFETVRNKLLNRNYRRLHHKEGSREK